MGREMGSCPSRAGNDGRGEAEATMWAHVYEGGGDWPCAGLVVVRVALIIRATPHLCAWLKLMIDYYWFGWVDRHRFFFGWTARPGRRLLACSIDHRLFGAHPCFSYRHYSLEIGFRSAILI